MPRLRKIFKRLMSVHRAKHRGREIYTRRRERERERERKKQEKSKRASREGRRRKEARSLSEQNKLVKPLNDP